MRPTDVAAAEDALRTGTPPQADGPRVGYVLKVYPRFSETFIVSEILAREAAGEHLDIFSLRPPADPRFHPELARVTASVSYITRPVKLDDGWQIMDRGRRLIPGFAERFAEQLPELAGYDASEVHQGIELAVQATERGIDHLHAHFGSLAARTAQIAARLAGITYSVTTHAKDLFHESVDPDRLRSVMRDAHHVVTISRYNLQFLRTEYPEVGDRLRLVYNGLELARFAYRPPQPVAGVLRIAAVGRLVEKKGFGLLIEAARRLRDRGLRIEVRIAGGGGLEEDLRTQIGAADLRQTVRLLGPVTQAEVAELLRWADAFAAPCVVGADGNADGLPTVLLEAMAMGIPVVSTAYLGTVETLDPVCSVVVDEDDDGIVPTHEW